MAKGTLKDAIKYAAENPTSDFANQLGQTIASGQVDGEAQKYGIDLTPIKQRYGKSEEQKQTGDKGIKGIATGVAKYGLESSIGTARLLQTGGQAIIAGGKSALTGKPFKETFEETKQTTGVKSLQGEQAAQIDEVLKAKSTEEKVGKGVGFVAELINPVGKAEEVASLVSKGKKAADIFMEGRKLAKSEKAILDLVDATSGVLDKKARISALERSGLKGGTKEEGILGALKVSANDSAINRAKAVEGIVKPGASPVKNLGSINDEIARVSEKEIIPALRSKPSIFNVKTIEARLSQLEKPDLIKADPILDKTYELVRQRMIDQVKKQPKTMEGLWNARKQFDDVVRDQFGDAAFNSEKNTAIKRAVSDMRREINNIIGENIPEYRPQLDRLSNMYDARYNIAEQFQDIVDAGGVKAWTTLNPKKAAALKWGLGGTSLYAGKEILGF